MKKTKILIILIAAITSFSGLYAQDSEQKTVNKNAVGIAPVAAFRSGLRIEYDRSISSDGYNWLIIAPTFYISANGYYETYYNDPVVGYGIEIKHRRFISQKTTKPGGFYFQYGPMFQNYFFKDKKPVNVNFVEGGNEYTTVEYKDVDVVVSRVGATIQVGYQWLIGKHFYIDAFAGVGIRVSFDNFNSGISPWYNDTWVDMAYSGTLLNTGVRFGFAF